jgi:hypothetical protein
LFADLSAEAQKVIDNMPVEELANVISFYEQIKMPLGGILGLEDLPANKNIVPRWRFQLGQPLVKQELVNKLPTMMRKFHDWYLEKSAAGLEMFGMLVRPGDFAHQNEKVVWLQFIDIYEIYYLDAVNTDLMIWLSSCVACNLMRCEGRVIQELLSLTYQKSTSRGSRTKKNNNRDNL